MKILVIGSGGREHALAWKLSQSPRVDKLYCAPGSAGIRQQAEPVDIAAGEIEKLADFAAREAHRPYRGGPGAAACAGDR